MASADLTIASILSLPAVADYLPPNVISVSLRRLNHAFHQKYASRTRVDCRDWLPLWAVKEGVEEAAQRSDRGTKQQTIKQFWHAVVASGDTDGLQVLATRGGSAWDRRIYEVAAAAGHVHVMRWAQRSDCPISEHGDELWVGTEEEFRKACTEAAASHGHVHLLQWLDSQGRLDASAVCSSLAAGGQLAVLQWARARSPPCPWDAAVCSKAAEFGQLAALKWLRAKGCPWDKSVCSKAAWGGHMLVLQWARAHGCPWDKATCLSAGIQGHLALLKWARYRGCTWDEGFAAGVAKSGQLGVLKWARGQMPSCPWDEEVTTNAALKGHMELLQWAVRSGCPCSGLARKVLWRERRKQLGKGLRGVARVVGGSVRRVAPLIAAVAAAATVAAGVVRMVPVAAGVVRATRAARSGRKAKRPSVTTARKAQPSAAGHQLPAARGDAYVFKPHKFAG